MAAQRACDRLVSRWVIGKASSWTKKERNLPPGPGLHVVSGGARGADTLCENIIRQLGEGLRRRTRAEFKLGELDVTTIGFNGEALILADGLNLTIFDAQWQLDGQAAGGLRNQKMVDFGLDEVLAFYAVGSTCNPEAAGGTNDMVRRSLAAGVKVHAYEASRRAWRTL